MTTRRQVLGAGLAAILAAGKAPAVLVRSMLGMRGAMTGFALPYDSEVDWIGGDGKAYIDTGVTQGNNTVTVVYQQLKYVYDSVVFGCFFQKDGSVATNHVDYLGYFPNSNYYGLGQGGTYHSLTNPTARSHFGEVWHTAVLDRRTGLTVDGVHIGSVANDVNYTGSLTYGVFRRKGAFPGATNPSMRLKSISIKSNITGDMLLDARAVCLDGSGYIYDRIGKRLLGNASSTGSFSIGPIV